MAKVNRHVPQAADKRKSKAGLKAQPLTAIEEAAIESFLLQAKIEAITPCPRSRTLH